MRPTRKERKRESGSALIAVLCLIFTAGLLVTAVVSMSQYNTFTLGTRLALQRSFYTAEGAANRIQWLIAADRNLHPLQILGEVDYSEYDYDRYLADGVVHTLDYYGETVEFVITDTQSGFDFSAQNANSTLQRLRQAEIDDTEYTELLDILGNRINDYNDSGDELSIDGMEVDDYDAEGKAPLPRNEAMKFREELFYITGFTDLFPPDRDGRLSAIRLISPENTGSLSGAPNLFSADRRLLKAFTQLEDENIEALLDALETYRRERTSFTDLLNDPLLLGNLANLSRNESGNYTVTIRPPQGSGRPGQRLTFSFPAFSIFGPQNNTVEYFEWIFY